MSLLQKSLDSKKRTPAGKAETKTKKPAKKSAVKAPAKKAAKRKAG
jgi:DNA end-binding protein Ku